MTGFASIADIRARLSGEALSHYPVQNGSMRAGLYAPKGEDKQTPHTQDELYIIHRGAGVFVKNGARRSFAAGDLIFVEAGVPHRFEDFSDDFETWVVFYGPQGGESGAESAAGVSGV